MKRLTMLVILNLSILCANCQEVQADTSLICVPRIELLNTLKLARYGASCDTIISIYQTKDSLLKEALRIERITLEEVVDHNSFLTNEVLIHYDKEQKLKKVIGVMATSIIVGAFIWISKSGN